jgi:hypothetical protein
MSMFQTSMHVDLTVGSSRIHLYGIFHFSRKECRHCFGLEVDRHVSKLDLPRE